MPPGKSGQCAGGPTGEPIEEPTTRLEYRVMDLFQMNANRIEEFLNEKASRGYELSFATSKHIIVERGGE